MTVLRDLINDAPIKVDLEFGVNKNIVLRRVDITKRVHAGAQIRRNTFMKFTEVHPVTKKGIREHEYSFFDLKHDSKYPVLNMNTKHTKLNEIMNALGVDENIVDELHDYYFDKFNIDVDDLDSIVKTPKGAKAIDDIFSFAFYDAIKDIMGMSGPLMYFKTTVDKKGYLELPMYGTFIEPMENLDKSTLTVSFKEYEMREKALETKTVGADKLGAPPSMGSMGGGLSSAALKGIV